jgi:hypothetical protein
MYKGKIEDLKPETILHTCWGWDMTINDFAVVLENTGKSLKCRMVGKKVVAGDPYGPGGTGKVAPDPEKKYGRVFRVRITKEKFGDGYWLVGSYPFIEEKEGLKKRGYWDVHDGREVYYENHWD